MKDEQSEVSMPQDMQTLHELEGAFHDCIMCAVQQVEMMGIEPLETVQVVLSGLMFETMKMALRLHMSEKEFLAMGRIAYRSIMPELKKGLS